MMGGMTMDSGYAASGSPTLLIADMPDDEAERAIGLTGGRLVERINWADAPSRIGDHAMRPVVLVEARGVAPAVLEAALPHLRDYAASLDLHLVVSLGVAEIDCVTAQLFGEGVQLLCDPTVADRVAAITVARQAQTHLTLHDPLRENEGAKLRQLNAEVAKIAEILARLTRSDDRPATTIGDRRNGYAAGPAPYGRSVDAAEVRRVIQLRRLRSKVFAGFSSEPLFEDPAWDMLLDLFAAQLEGVRVSVSSLCIAAAVAPTTALRWIAKMTELGLFVRHPDPDDRRRAFMALSSRAADAMRSYLAQAAGQGIGAV